MHFRSLTLAAFLALGPASAGGIDGTTPRAATIVARPFAVTAPDGWVFRGELTLPREARAAQRFPTVLLVHGSGANDMNETIPEAYARAPGGSANFLLLARRLSASGFAVARFHKRGVTGLGPQSLPPERMVGPAYTPSGIARDALTVLRRVRRLPGVDASRLFLLGHSEGTDIVSKIAAEHPAFVRGVVMIGVSGDPGKDSLRLQIVDNQVGYARAFDRDRDGRLGEDEVNAAPRAQAVWLGLWEAMGAVTSNGGRYRFTRALDARGERQVDIARDFSAFLAAYFDRTYPDFPFMGPNWGAYMRDAERFGFTTTLLPRYRGPVLMMNGDRDDQTPLSGALRAYRAVRASGNRDATLAVYPGTGHTLAPLRGGLTTLGPMNEQALSDLTRWLQAHAQK